MNTPDPDDLSAKLRRWVVEPQVSGSFRREVWLRVAALQIEREGAFWPHVRQWFSTQLTRPQYATALVVLSLSASIVVAHLQARWSNSRNWKELEARYATSVDPLAMSR